MFINDVSQNMKKNVSHQTHGGKSVEDDAAVSLHNTDGCPNYLILKSPLPITYCIFTGPPLFYVFVLYNLFFNPSWIITFSIYILFTADEHSGYLLVPNSTQIWLHNTHVCRKVLLSFFSLILLSHQLQDQTFKRILRCSLSRKD